MGMTTKLPTLPILRIVGFLGLTAASLPIALATVPPAAAAPCPDVEVVFARGTTEPPGVGGIGHAFVESLRSQLGERSVGVYAVNYPASRDFGTSAPAGRDDVSAHVQARAASCPATRMVLGGYSQGAAVVDLATAAMPSSVADHVAAAAIFGGPRSSFADSLSPGPLPAVGPLYAAKTVELCVPNDPICSEGGRDWGAHGAYVRSGMVDQAATFAAGRL
jgi:cutinase